MAHRFVDLGENGEKVYLHDEDQKKVRQVLWGDWLMIDENPASNQLGAGWLPVIWAPNSPNPRMLYIKEDHTTEQRPLEIIFLDVGQGDGAVLITPERGEDERIMVIDAGEGRHMCNFLNSRFKAYRGFDFDSAIITHPDMDHYLGFESIFSDHDIGFETIYHSGLVERPVSGTFAKLGDLTEDPATGVKYFEDLAVDTADIDRIFGAPVDLGDFVFPRVMRKALENPQIKAFRMLSTFHSTAESGRTYMPGFAPSDGKPYAIEVLGPVAEINPGNQPRLRKISSNYGKTKNGHSVILRLHYSNIKVLFGGDLNIPAEKFLLTHYTGLSRFPSKSSPTYADMVTQANEWFGADVIKVCHHGSEKVTNAFMAAVNPAVFVISSGDQEGHVHPRPDLLGRLGRFGRGESPVLLSTELQRSTREREDQKLVARLLREIDTLTNNPTDKLKLSIQEKIRQLARTNVDVYGAIYVKTDGERLITAFKIESDSDTKKWFYFEYILDSNGILTLT